jgi:ribonuclease VapC
MRLKMNKVILDSSALIALIKNEKGAEIVEQLLGQIVMSTLNISEAAGILIDLGMPEEECKNSIEPYVDLVVPLDMEQSFEMAYLKKLTSNKGLSIGDRACIALGIKMKLPIYTADKIWATLQLEGAEIILIR